MVLLSHNLKRHSVVFSMVSWPVTSKVYTRLFQRLKGIKLKGAILIRKPSTSSTIPVLIIRNYIVILITNK